MAGQPREALAMGFAVAGKRVLITGASSGVGAALAAGWRPAARWSG
ncbi:hypothetical protein I553_0703 [Mycobacterium xenopi 4042]|uniref:Short chain dehydrogenase family protein n=1 Tax=Mycobacterium xenopi 4042 TaxID=1299334 RepID=X7YLR5_MYCXE|nr:hypothetical protein I553_0703 [Mycobacterium xenopi 4042]EUA52595.1 hypothetical protein I552_8703 [Mycobacterium xenopi 3993]